MKYVFIFSVLTFSFLFTKAQEKEAPLDAPACQINGIKTVSKSMNFLIMGDWGRHGEPHQRKVAEQMSNATICTKATFNLIVGDNFYCYNNQLNSLEGCPTTVDGSFSCFNNKKRFNIEYVSSLCKVKGSISV